MKNTKLFIGIGAGVIITGASIATPLIVLNSNNNSEEASNQSSNSEKTFQNLVWNKVNNYTKSFLKVKLNKTLDQITTKEAIDTLHNNGDKIEVTSGDYKFMIQLSNIQENSSNGRISYLAKVFLISYNEKMIQPELIKENIANDLFGFIRFNDGTNTGGNWNKPTGGGNGNKPTQPGGGTGTDTGGNGNKPTQPGGGTGTDTGGNGNKPTQPGGGTGTDTGGNGNWNKPDAEIKAKFNAIIDKFNEREAISKYGDEFLFPKMLLVRETIHGTELMPLKVNLPSNYKVKYYGPNGLITDLKRTNLLGGIKVFVNVFDSNDDLVVGQEYSVINVGTDLLKVKDGNESTFDSENITNKILSKKATISDITRFMDKLKWGKKYKANGNLLGGKNTNSTLMSKIDGVASTDFKWKNNFYSPFIDPTTETGWVNGHIKLSDSKFISSLKRYKMLTFAFLTGSSSREWSWAGSAQNVMIPLINGIRKQGGDIIVSIGGAIGSDPWNNADPILFARQLEGVVKGYHLKKIDFDIEGQKQGDISGITAAAIGVALLQQKIENEYKAEMQKPPRQRDNNIISQPYLDFDLTLPSEYDGLRTSILDIFVSAGVKISKLNGMTMMMNAGHVQELGGLPGAVKSALTHLKNSIKTSYKRVGVDLTDSEAFSMVGSTIDIATDTWKNEIAKSPQEFDEIVKWAKEKNVGHLSFWNVNSDDPNFKAASGARQHNGYKPHEVDDAYSKFNDGNNELRKDILTSKMNSKKMVLNALNKFYKIGNAPVVPPNNSLISQLRSIKNASLKGAQAFGEASGVSLGGRGKTIFQQIDKIIKATKIVREKEVNGLDYSKIYNIKTLSSHIKPYQNIIVNVKLWSDGHLYISKRWIPGTVVKVSDLQNTKLFTKVF